MRLTAAAAILLGIAGPAGAQQTADTLPPRPGAAADAGPAIRHTVRPGDTLWDIARAYLKDPFRWPEVFHANTDIVRNPHWIYPGQVLTIDRAAVKPEIVARADSSGVVAPPAPPAPPAQPAPAAPAQTVFLAAAPAELAGPAVTVLEPPPALTVRPGEYEAAPYVVSAPAGLPTGRVIGAVETLALGLSSDAGFRFNDRLYLSRPAGAAIHDADELVLAIWRETIPGRGRVLEPTGVVRIDSAPATGAIVGRIVRQFGTVNVDQLVLAPAAPFAGTTTRPVPGAYPLTARVVWIRNAPVLPSLQTYVILDAGRDRGVQPGDQFTLLDDAPGVLGRHTPPVATATVTVVRVSPTASTAIVVHQTQPSIHAGMAAHLSARMP